MLIVGVPWCRQEDYDAFRMMFEDRDNLPREWIKFAEIAEMSERHHKGQGDIVERVDIDPKEFWHWCAENGYRINRDARLEFAYREALRRHPGHG